ncbi:MAG: hypothetical protein AB1449_14710 [Chloroflexota bacterium]
MSLTPLSLTLASILISATSVATCPGTGVAVGPGVCGVNQAFQYGVGVADIVGVMPDCKVPDHVAEGVAVEVEVG